MKHNSSILLTGILFAFLLAFASGCASLDTLEKEILTATPKENLKFPPMEAEFIPDEEPPVDKSLLRRNLRNLFKESPIPDPRGIQKKILENEISENLCSFDGMAGTHPGRVWVAVDTQKSELQIEGLYFVLSVIPPWPCLFGLPPYSVVADTKITMKIFSPNGTLLKTYNATGHTKKWCALWWGYSPDNLHVNQLALAESFKYALDDAIRQLSDDKLLREKLISGSSQ